jgi:hypothetical protein
MARYYSPEKKNSCGNVLCTVLALLWGFALIGSGYWHLSQPDQLYLQRDYWRTYIHSTHDTGRSCIVLGLIVFVCGLCSLCSICKRSRPTKNTTVIRTVLVAPGVGLARPQRQSAQMQQPIVYQVPAQQSRRSAHALASQTQKKRSSSKSRSSAGYSTSSSSSGSYTFPIVQAQPCAAPRGSRIQYV